VFNPRDARFLGSPIDFIVFNGLDDGEECREVVLVEVKTGTSPLSKRERQVRDAVEAGRVSYRLIRLTPPRENHLAAEVDAAGAAPQARPALRALGSASFAPRASDSLRGEPTVDRDTNPDRYQRKPCAP
jgi:hypothetical protein